MKQRKSSYEVLGTRSLAEKNGSTYSNRPAGAVSQELCTCHPVVLAIVGVTTRYICLMPAS